MNESERVHILSAGATDVGRRRRANEDSFLCDDELGLWVVADGMGGHAAGDVASQEAIDTIYGMVKRGRLRIDSEYSDEESRSRAGARLLEGSVQAATYMIYAMSELDQEKAGMGTTISALMSMGDYAVTAQVGDSRIYQVREGTAQQITEDHTLINWQLKKGIITQEQAKRSKHKNVITRAVGNRDYVQVDTNIVQWLSGDRYLLCSDGLHGYLLAPEIPPITDRDRNEAVQLFIDLANNRGGKDNITAIVLEVL